MSTHPALQPVLRQSNVSALLNRLDFIAAPADATPEYMAGFHAGISECRDLINMMWQASVIATDAHNKELERDAQELAEEDNGHAANDKLGELAAISRDLLKLADRLDEAEG